MDSGGYLSWMMGKERVVLYHLTLLHLVWRRRIDAIEFDTGYCLLYVDVYLVSEPWCSSEQGWMSLDLEDAHPAYHRLSESRLSSQQRLCVCLCKVQEDGNTLSIQRVMLGQGRTRSDTSLVS